MPIGMNPALRETRKRLLEVYEANQLQPLVRDVYEVYAHTIDEVQNAADRLWHLGEIRWAAAMESRAIDLEMQARRNLEGVLAKLKSNGGGHGGSDDVG